MCPFPEKSTAAPVRLYFQTTDSTSGGSKLRQAGDLDDGRDA
jgi:hypothetical protein